MKREINVCSEGNFTPYELDREPPRSRFMLPIGGQFGKGQRYRPLSIKPIICGHRQGLFFSRLATAENQNQRFFEKPIVREWLYQRLEKIITFDTICHGDQIIKLKSPIKVEGVLSDEGCSLYYEPLDIFVSASTWDECEEDFQEVLDVLFEQYAMDKDENLTEGAQELKRKLLELVDEI